jgi:hypothetical protein
MTRENDQLQATIRQAELPPGAGTLQQRIEALRRTNEDLAGQILKIQGIVGP